MLSQLRTLRGGRVTVIEGGLERQFGRGHEDPTRDLHATVNVHDPSVWSAVALGGSAASGETYAQGVWDCDDLAALVRLFARNESANVALERGLARLGWLRDRWVHAFRRNTVRGSRENISAHYDVGNDFFARLLDETMMYSSAYFETPDASLKEATTAKNDRLCRMLELEAGDHLLEIGTGWGGFAIHAASRFGCRVTTTTVSREQYDLARERVREAGLDDRVDVLLRDYRELEGEDRFDRIVSIEMIEAVGHEYYEEYFRTCGRLLRPEGAFAMQAITVPDRDYDRCRRNVDFIKKHVFPGCCIPSVEILDRHAADAAGLRRVEIEDISAHYAETLRRWRRNLDTHEGEIRSLGYSEEFVRLWRYYLAYCEGGFEEGTTFDVQLLWAGPKWSRRAAASRRSAEPHEATAPRKADFPGGSSVPSGPPRAEAPAP
jgi:cyclopropane-fatty-acyl-phospholipid synthase